MDLGSGPNASHAGPVGNSSSVLSRQHGAPFRTVEAVLIIGAAGSLSLLTVLGNALVLLSIALNRHLQTVSNHFLFTLACADLLIGMFSMNLYTAYVLKGHWPLGRAMCDLWLVVDYVVSNASNMNLVLISVDRYLCVARPLTYPPRRTRRLASLLVAAAWVASLLLWAPAILTWQRIRGQRLHQDECYIQLLSSPAVTLATAVPSFYLPAVVMAILYARISRAGRRRVPRLSAAPDPTAATATTPGLHRATTPGLHRKRRRRMSVRERKVTRTVLAVLLAFLVTWLPYNAMVMVGTFCHVCVPDTLWTLGYWLRYANSTVNPACYALCSATFRRTFRKLLLCQYKNINSK